MIIPLEDHISDQVAAMIEPLSVGLHAVLKRVPKKKEKVLIVGGGMIGYAVLVALRLLGIDCHITQLNRYSHQQEMSLKLGADESFTHRTEAEELMLSFPETSRHKPLLGKDVYLGGFDVIYDCIVSKESLDDALRMAKEGGKIILAGGAGYVRNLDWSFIWANELSVIGTHAYAKNEWWEGKKISTQALLLKLLAQNKDYPLESLVTHEFPLNAYQEAMIVNLESKKYKSIKTLFKIS